MRKGRHRDDYPEADFLAWVTSKMKMRQYNRREAIALSLAALADQAGINRGSLSRFMKGKPASRATREILLGFLDGTPEERARFVVGPKAPSSQNLDVPDTNTSPRHRLLNRGQERIFRAQYPKALAFLNKAVDLANSDKDFVDLADAYMRIAWVHFEKGDVDACKDSLSLAIKAVETHFDGEKLASILSSVRPGSRSAVCLPGDHASRVLSTILHLQAKFYAERVAHCGAYGHFRDAALAFERTIALNTRREDQELLAHDLRWEAVFLASDLLPERVKRAQKLLDESEHLFDPRQIGMAYLARDQGLVHFYEGQLAKARKSLHTAIDRLAEFNDSRGWAQYSSR